ncbi:MAG TPA: four helix bundle protein [Candidatus Saccharibacteria bacterium]|jgi:four helix bundle protein|nr:hypothetical protein [Patescibacteria group bacterium]HMS30767.1 four helix bundle protein [Candidatus Saccharibacteria bacterium]
MTEIRNTKQRQYDLETRVLEFAKACRKYVKTLKPSIISIEDGKQMVRSSGSVGANYLEANEAISKKDFLHRLRIAKKEARETIYWLKLLEAPEPLIKEASELMHILGAILEKSK